MSVIPCYRGGHYCKWPACPPDCDGRPQTEFDVLCPVPPLQQRNADDMGLPPTQQVAVQDGQGVIKNERYFNTGKTYNADGTLRFDFDASNARDPWFNGDTFHGYDDEGCPIWNKAKSV